MLKYEIFGVSGVIFVYICAIYTFEMCKNCKIFLNKWKSNKNLKWNKVTKKLQLKIRHCFFFLILTLLVFYVTNEAILDVGGFFEKYIFLTSTIIKGC